MTKRHKKARRGRDKKDESGEENDDNNDDETPHPCPKKTCIRSSAEPDVTIVVGGQEYHEYSQSLSCWSGYFDRALRSGMKESQSMRFEFPERDPQEWEWIVAVTAPLATESITKDSLGKALSWFDELCSERGLQECDRVLCREISGLLPTESVKDSNLLAQTDHRELRALKRSLRVVVDALATCIQYGLRDSKAICLSTIQRCVKSRSTLRLFRSKTSKRMAKCLADDQESYDALWYPLSKFLPRYLKEEDRKNTLFPDIVSTGIKSTQIERAPERPSHCGGRVADGWYAHAPFPDTGIVRFLPA